MLSINSFAVSTWGATSSLTGVPVARAEDSGKASTSGASDTSSISTLARQLSEAAERAAARDANLSRNQLATLAKSLESKYFGEGFNTNRAIANAEVPDTDDPELLARAEQATRFVNSRWSGKNPFAGLSREQLALIMYDRGDAFTLNERAAAFYEHHRQREAWAQKVCAQAQIEQQATGTFTNFYKACIAEYQAAPLIEQATYPEDYVARREYYIRLWESGVGIHFNADSETLIEMLLPEREYDEKLSWGLDSVLPMPGASEVGGLAESARTK